MFPGIFSTNFPRLLLTRPNAPITTGTVSVLKPHILSARLTAAFPEMSPRSEKAAEIEPTYP